MPRGFRLGYTRHPTNRRSSRRTLLCGDRTGCRLGICRLGVRPCLRDVRRCTEIQPWSVSVGLDYNAGIKWTLASRVPQNKCESASHFLATLRQHLPNLPFFETYAVAFIEFDLHPPVHDFLNGVTRLFVLDGFVYTPQFLVFRGEDVIDVQVSVFVNLDVDGKVFRVLFQVLEPVDCDGDLSAVCDQDLVIVDQARM